tara:strand:- start:1340 stop:2716 length:1377 start_codon:yes stop_codon:yes gene_type:complete
MDYKIYENVFNDELIDYIISNLDENRYRDGRVGAGARVNKKQKNRKDLFIYEDPILHKIDETFYTKHYQDIKENFSDIIYREKWKLGKYEGNDNGFYNVHRDDSDETAFRSTSIVAALSDPSDYEGGELCFDSLNVQLKLKKGSIVVFKSGIFHHVTPVTSGTRIVMISFFFNETGRKIKEKLNPVVNISQYKPILKTIKLNYEENIDSNHFNKTVTKVLGDIDYSDNSSNHVWTDTDDIFYEDNDSDVLLIPFAGMGWKNSIPTFIFYNFLNQYKSIDKLFIRDINCRYYMTGLKNSTLSFEETIELIKSYCTKKKYRKIIGLGCSAGGFAAILYGQLLNFTKVLAFAPQTVINRKKDELIEDIYNAPKTCKWLQTKSNEPLYQKSLDLNNFSPFDKCPIDIHYSVNGNNGIDKKHALYIECEGCKIIEHPGNDHMIALTLRNNGKLKNIIENEILC